MNVRKLLWSIVRPQPSLHAPRKGNYEFSYRKEVMGKKSFFTIPDAVNEAEARMLAERKMSELAMTENALLGSHRLAKAP